MPDEFASKMVPDSSRAPKVLTEALTGVEKLKIVEEEQFNVSHASGPESV